MGRFRYIPQSYNSDTEEKAITESEPLEINIKEEGEYIDNTIVVYDDFKIPLNITEDLAKETLEIKNTIEKMYNLMSELDKLMDKTSDLYDNFENHVFGKVPYSYKYGGFDYYDEDHICKPLEWNGRVYNKSTIPLDFEIQKLDYAKSSNEYNKAFLESKKNIINPSLIDTVNTMDSKIDVLEGQYDEIRGVLVDDNFWNFAKISMESHQDRIELMKDNVKNMAYIKVSCPELEEGDI